MIICYDPNIPKDKILIFHKLISEFGGRYLQNPRELWVTISVSYAFDDIENFNSFNRAWRNAVAGVFEVRKDQWWRKILRKIGFRRW